MLKNRHLPLSLAALAILSACSTTTQNPALMQARTHYNEARNNPQITNQAATELNEARESLSKADLAFEKGEKEATVNHLAYVVDQKVRIAQETAFRKTDEMTVTNAGSKRNELRLNARTAEADAAKAEATAAKQEVLIVAETAMQQSQELAAANANTERDQALIAKQEQQLNALNAKQTKRGLVITLGDVLFSSGKSELKSGGMNNVRKLADFLTEFPQHKVLIEGYTDSVGSDSLNLTLSGQRANAVRTALVDMGIGSDRITTRGYGEQFPAANNKTSSNRQLNRRVEIILSDSNGNIATR